MKIYPKFTNEELAALSLGGELPHHVGIIMDGNGRWAKKRLLPRSAGHRAGMESLHQIVRTTHSLGIEALTVYAFSTENWARPATEIDALFKLLSEYFYKEIDELNLNGVRIRTLGELSAFKPGLRSLMEDAVERSITPASVSISPLTTAAVTKTFMLSAALQRRALHPMSLPSKQ